MISVRRTGNLAATARNRWRRTMGVITKVGLPEWGGLCAVLLALAGCGSENSRDQAGPPDGGVAFAPGTDWAGEGAAGLQPDQVEARAPVDVLRAPEAEVTKPDPDAAEPPPETSCTPACEGKDCGDDGCSGVCGACPEAAPLCIEDKCHIDCTPECAGKECGDDGCYGTCGDCPADAPDCVDSLCVVQCFPDCVGKECGDDGCSGECGPCPLAAPLCVDSLCAVQCFPDCVGKECGGDGCDGDCGSCPEDLPLCENGVCNADPATLDGCTEEGKQIFLVTEAKSLLRFEPVTSNIVNIGSLDCAAAFGETPYSMSVDRNSFAWVLYSDGSLWKVSTEDASCLWTPFQPNQLGFEIFGMGFSTDGANTLEETLFIAGGDYWDLQFGDATLGSIDLETLAVSSIAPFSVGSGLPELTGNRSGELWGFFAQTSPPRIARIDKTSAAQFQAIELSPQLFANVQAWAFAFWGGDFYIFFKSDWDAASGVWKIAGGTGSVTEELASTGHVITGAGVSTCAPVDGGQ